jgi:hypothetical protein
MGKNILLGLSLVTVNLLISGCGGGSSRESSLFKKDAVSAPASIESGKEVAKNVATNKNSSKIGSLNAEEKEADSNMIIEAGSSTPILSKSIVKFAKKYTKKRIYALNQSIDETESCEKGSMHLKGSVNQNGAGTISMTFNSCKEYGILMDGAMSMTLKGSEDSPESIKTVFTKDTVLQTNSNKTTIFKNSNLLMDNFSGSFDSLDSFDMTSTIKVDFDMTSTIKVDVDGKLYGSKNSKWRFSESKMYQLSGKEYINNLKEYVTYDESYDMSKTPFKYSYNSLISGEARYVAKNNGKIIIQVTNPNELTIKIDADNDGTYETTEVVSQ